MAKTKNKIGHIWPYIRPIYGRWHEAEPIESAAQGPKPCAKRVRSILSKSIQNLTQIFEMLLRLGSSEA